MIPAPIKNEKQYRAALKDLEKVFDAKPNTVDGDLAEVLILLIENYEKKHFVIDSPDPVEAIKFRMEQQGLTNKDMVQYFGSKSLVSEVLARQRNLSMKMMRALHKGLGMSYDILMGEAPSSMAAEPRSKYGKR